MDVAGIDIYHPTQDALTGIEISFGGDIARSMKAGRNYLVIETQAQGFPQWVPYPGQLRLQAFSHLASGAEHARLLALALDPQLGGDVLEGAAQPRLPAEPDLRRGEDDRHATSRRSARSW